MGYTLFRLDTAGTARLFCPYGRCLDVGTSARLAISALKDVGVDRVNVTVIINKPVTGFGALLASPFSLTRSIGVECQTHRNH